MYKEIEIEPYDHCRDEYKENTSNQKISEKKVWFNLKQFFQWRLEVKNWSKSSIDHKNCCIKYFIPKL